MTDSVQREAHIDGLRSLAILPVVLYHAGLPAVPGGFVGVDVFFVISGYLITRILAREIDGGSFSLWRFYERRARRIMPALFFVAGAASVFAVLFLLPDDLIRFGMSLLSAILFASNFYFYRNTGYFDVDSDNYALLHTWSLAVEEQFYLLFPLILFVLSKVAGRSRRWVILLMAITSLALSVWASNRLPAFAFYLPFTRAWELLAGSLLAIGAVPAVTRQLSREVVAVGSLIAIVATILLLHDSAPFPGWIALAPVLGAVGIIHCAPGTWTGRLLSTPALVGVGLISYSLYLWHWPLLVFGAYWLIRPLQLIESMELMIAAVALATLTWALVEQPFRNSHFLKRRTIFAATITGIALFAGVGCILQRSGGLPARVPFEVSRLAAFTHDISPERRRCHGVAIKKSCVFGADVNPTIAVWGDSHGVEIAYALGESAAAHGRSLIQFTQAGCSPSARHSSSGCAKRNDAVLRYIEKHTELSTVIIVLSIGDRGEEVILKYLPGLDAAVARLRKADKVVVLTFPDATETLSAPSRLALERWRWGWFNPTLYPISQFESRFRNVYAGMEQIAELNGAFIVRPTDVTCPNGQCVDYLDGKVLMFDRHHPSLSGARLMAPLYEDVIARH